ncbi:MAG: hypothetical protein JWP44_4742 [Mucilaginibacter sp.]|nr:hypothetical protein [Mucilaginibacter sp.]
MVPQSFNAFFVASTGASAALIGLLFVAVSIAPGQVFGPHAIARGQAAATSAFTALVNVFFVSLVGLAPKANIGQVSVILGVLTLLQTLENLRHVHTWKRARYVIRSLVLVLAGLGVYGSELWLGLQLLHTPTNTSAVSSLLGVLLGMYAIGLARSWELLGAQDHHTVAFSLLSRLLPADHADAHANQATGPTATTESDDESARPDAAPANSDGEANAVKKEPEKRSP